MNNKFRRILSLMLIGIMVVSMIPATFAAGENGESINLVPVTPVVTGNYVNTWNIQDWVGWHELYEQTGGKFSDADLKNHKRNVVDPDHIFGNEEKGIAGWANTFEGLREDLIFVIDDGWDLPYDDYKNHGRACEHFGSHILPTDKWPEEEWGDTPWERLKNMNDKIVELGWAGTGMVIHNQESKAYPEYYCNGDLEQYWKMRMEWSRYAGIKYWKVDWGWHMTDVTYQANLEKWAEEVYPELIIEHAHGGTGGKSTQSNMRLPASYLENAVEFGAFGDVYRTYDVLDPLMTCITLDRVGEQILAGYTQADTEQSKAIGLLNAEDEMYIAASLGLTFGVMRSDPDLAENTANSDETYFDKGTEKNVTGGTDGYFAGGHAFVQTRATRTSLDEVARATMWGRIAPAYTIGDYDVELSNYFLDDNWTFTSAEPSWEGQKGKITQRAPAAIARGIDLPTVTTSNGEATPYLTASRNPNGAISIAAYARTFSNTGYTHSKTAAVKLNAGDLTGKIGVFGYFGSLELTFNQDLTGKTILAQDLLATEAEDITNQNGVTVNGNTITIDGALLERIGLSAATEGDTSEPGLVIQIGDEKDFVEAAEINERIDSWDVNNASFEKFVYDGAHGETMKSVTGADWRRSGTTAASYITEGGHTGSYAAIHTSNSNYSVTTYHDNKVVPNGVYTVSAWVKASANANAQLQAVNTGSGTKSAAIAQAADWTQVTIENVEVTNNRIQVQVVSNNAAANSYVIFDDVEVKPNDGIIDNEITADVILDFNFSDYEAAGDGSAIVTGTANGKAVTATAQNVTFKTDEESNDVVVFPIGGDNTTTGITYDPGEDDPMATLNQGDGATVVMWIKTAQDTFNSPLLTYGALNAAGDGLGASMQIMGRNNAGGDVMFYRNQAGQTGGHKIPSIGNPYVVGQWQMVTYVENGDGSGTMYIDGVSKGTIGASDKTLLGFATDTNTPDKYYIGFNPYENGDTHFAGEIDRLTIYNEALTPGQIENLYKEYFLGQTEIVLNAVEGELGGQAVKYDAGYVGYLGGTAGTEEGTVTFTFDVKKAGNWKMDVYYLSKASNYGKDNNREFDAIINGDTENVITFRCPEGNSWDDPSLASVYTIDSIALKEGKNSIALGNTDDDAPSLVKVVLTRLEDVDPDAAAAAAVEKMIKEKLPIVDDLTMRNLVEECRAAYDALTDEQKALVDPEVYKMLTDAEVLMEQWWAEADAAAKAVTDQINAIGEVTSLDQKIVVEQARAAYDALNENEKGLISADTLAKLEAAEAKIVELENEVVIGDLNADGRVNVVDIMRLKILIKDGQWTQEELRIADANKNGTLDVTDIALLKEIILNRED